MTGADSRRGAAAPSTLRAGLDELLAEGAPHSFREVYLGGGLGGRDRMTAPRVRLVLRDGTVWTWFDGQQLRTESLRRGDALVLHNLATVRQEQGLPDFIEVTYFEGVVSLDRVRPSGTGTRKDHAPVVLDPRFESRDHFKDSFESFFHYGGHHHRAEVRRCYLRLALIQLLDLFAADESASAADRPTAGIGLPAKAAIFNYVFQHCRRPLPRRELAEVLGVSEDYVNTLCRRTFGRTFTQLLLFARLLTARDHIEESRHSIADVGHVCGFRNTAHFIKRYRELFERTPLQMRKEYLALRRDPEASVARYHRALGFRELEPTPGALQEQVSIRDRRPAAVLFGNGEHESALRVYSLEPDHREALFCEIPARGHNYCFAFAEKVWVARNELGEELGRYRLPPGDSLLVPAPGER